MNRKRLGLIFAAALILPCSESLRAGCPAPQTLEEAKSKLQEGVNGWNQAPLESSRNLFLALLLKNSEPNGFLLNYLALVDYRLAAFHLSAGNAAEGERYVSEGQQYATKAVDANPSFGEPYALYAFLLGLELAFHPDRAMTLGMKSSEWFAKALEIGPDNPRINLLKGISQIYVPEAFGGGPDSALPYLEKSAALFEKEDIREPLKPSWGREEVHAYLGRVFRMKKDFDKAKSHLTKAVEINPDFGLAKAELQAMVRNEPER
ncbi:MAG: tetratricopeptide repeat protein [Candidatus Aminicenantes bacterium]|nr:tetratricopeptide repeat protein [Candidatus Aminicenantes bacterium]